MAADEPPYLTVGTDVSAKYKGAFCEAKIKKVNRVVKCKVTFKNNQGTGLIPDDQIKGALRIGAHVEARHPEKNQFMEAVINKLLDYSQYTVVFDDGDETTLRRTSLCLKSGRHFAESPTLDQFPLTNPEHFGTPVIGSKAKRKRRSTMNSASLDYDSSDEELILKKSKIIRGKERDPDLGKVVCVDFGDRRKKDNWYPGLVVASSGQDTVKINSKEEYLIRSFKDGKYYQVPKKDTREFTKEIGLKVDSNTLRIAVEKAVIYLEKEELPPHWDKALLMGLELPSADEESHDSDSDTSDDEPSEEKDRFVAQLYKFMDERGTPINKAPTVGNRDLNLYKLFKIMHKMGGYNRVTNQNQWKTVYSKMGLPSSNPAGSNQIKLAYKRYLHSFEDFYRKLGCTMVTNSRSTRVRHRSDRNFIITRNRDRDISSPKGKFHKDTKDKCIIPKKLEDKPKADDGKKTEEKVKIEDSIKVEDKQKHSEKKKIADKSRSEEDKGKIKKEEDKPRLVRSQSLNKDRREKERDEEKKEAKPEKARTREDARREKAESPEKKETRASVKNEQERERREKEEMERKETDQVRKERPVREKDKKEQEKHIKKEERNVKDEKLLRDKKEEKIVKDKKEEKLVKDKSDENSAKEKEEKSLKEKKEEKLKEKKDEKVVKEEKPIKDKREEKLVKEKKEEKSMKDKKDEKFPKEKKEEKLLKEKKEERLKEKKDEKTPKKDEKLLKDKKDEKLLREKKDEKITKEKKEERPLKEKKDEKPLKEKREEKPVKEKKEEKPLREKKEEKPLKEERLIKEKKEERPPKERKDEKIVKETDKEKPEVKSLHMKTRNEQDDDSSNKQFKKRLIKPEEIKPMPQSLESDDEDFPLSQEKSDKKEIKEGEIEIGDKVKVKYGRGRMQKVYEAKVLKVEKEGGEKRYYVHYAGWNMRYDEWVKKNSIVENMSERNRAARKKKQVLNAKNFLVKMNMKRGRPPGSFLARKLTRKSSTSSTSSSIVSCSRTTRSDKNGLSSSPYSAGLEPRRRTRKKSGISVTLTDTSQDSESDVDHMLLEPDEDLKEIGRPTRLPKSEIQDFSDKEDKGTDDEDDQQPRKLKEEKEEEEEEKPMLVEEDKNLIKKEIKKETPKFEKRKFSISLDKKKGQKDEKQVKGPEMKLKKDEPRKEVKELTTKSDQKATKGVEDKKSATEKKETEKKNVKEKKENVLKKNVSDKKDVKEKTEIEERKELKEEVDLSESKEKNEVVEKTDNKERRDSDEKKYIKDKNQTEIRLSIESKVSVKKESNENANEINEKIVMEENYAIEENITRENNDTSGKIDSKESKIATDQKEVKEKKDISEKPDNEHDDLAEKINVYENDGEKRDSKESKNLCDTKVEKDFSTKKDKEKKVVEEREDVKTKDEIEKSECSENKDVVESKDYREMCISDLDVKEQNNILENEIKTKKDEHDKISNDNRHINDNEETKQKTDGNDEKELKDNHLITENIVENSVSVKKDLNETSSTEECHGFPQEKEFTEDKYENPSVTISKKEAELASKKIHCIQNTEERDKESNISTDTPKELLRTSKRRRMRRSESFSSLQIVDTSDGKCDSKTKTEDLFVTKDFEVNCELFPESKISIPEMPSFKETITQKLTDIMPPIEIAEVGNAEQKIHEKKCDEMTEEERSEELHNSVIELAAAVAASVAKAIPLAEPPTDLECQEESLLFPESPPPQMTEFPIIVPDISITRNNSALEEKKQIKRSVEQNFVEEVFQNLEKRLKMKEETLSLKLIHDAQSEDKSKQEERVATSNENNGMSFTSISLENKEPLEEAQQNILVIDTDIKSDNDELPINNIKINQEKQTIIDVKKEQSKEEEKESLNESSNTENIILPTDKLQNPPDFITVEQGVTLGKVADIFLETHSSEKTACKDENLDQTECFSGGSKKETKRKKTKGSKQDKKMGNLGEGIEKEGKGKSKKKSKSEHDDYDKLKDPEQKNKSKKLKKNKNKKRFTKYDDPSSDSSKKAELKDEEGKDSISEKIKKKEKRKRDEKKFNKNDGKNEDIGEAKLESSKKEKKKGKKNKDKFGSDKKSEISDKRIKKKKKVHINMDNLDSDSEKESVSRQTDTDKQNRLSRKEKKKEKKKIKMKDSSSSDDAGESKDLLKEISKEHDGKLGSFEIPPSITNTLHRQDSKSDDPDMSFLLCEEKVPASPVGISAVPEDTSGSSSIEENNSLTGQTSSDIEKMDHVNVDAYRPDGVEVLEMIGKHDPETCAVLDNTPPTTPSSTESLLSSSPSHERESFSLQDPESTRSGRESGEGESDSFHCESNRTEVTESEEYRAAATLAFAVCKSVPEKPKETSSRASLKRQKSESDEASPSKRRKKNKRLHSMSEITKPGHGRHKSILCRSSKGENRDGYDSSGANSATAANSPPQGSASMQNASFPQVTPQHLAVSGDGTTHTSPRPSKFNFYVPLHDYKDSDKRIAILQEKLSELRRAYMSLKTEVALIDRRKKKAKKKEKEAAGAAAANSSSHSEEVQCSS